MINRVYKATLQQMGGGTEEIQKGDEVTPIKYGTFHYAATAGNPAKYGKGGAFSSYIEFEYYISGGVTLNKGDMLLYAQEWETDTSFADITPSREQGINVFYVTEIKEKRETIYILAYDLVEYLLDVDFSKTLKANEANFPMTIGSLYGLVQTLTGVYAPWHSIALMPPDRSNFWKTAKVGYFYSSNITARDILNWIGEIIGQSLLFLWDGDFSLIGTSKKTIHKTFTNAGNNYWQNANKYIVCPDDGTYTIDGNTAINAWYKENGLEVGKAFTTYDGVELIASDGSVLGSYYTATPATNVLRIVGNMIVENIIEFGTFQPETIPPTYGTYNDLAEDILAGANVVSGMNYAKVQLFPFRCPYTIGSRMYCVDRDGNTYIVPIMSIDLTDNEVVIGAYGNEYATDSSDDASGGSGGSSDPAIWSKINQFDAKIDNIGIQIDEILDEKSIPTTATSYDCEWGHYDALVICAMFYSNVMATIFIPTSYFRATTTTLRPIVYDPVNSRRFDVYKADNDSVYLVGFSTPGAAYGVRIYGVSSRKDIASVEYLTTADGNYLTTVDGDYLTL